MSDDAIIKAEKLCKSYQLYDRPHQRLFGLFRRGAASGGRVHHALFDVDLLVRRGEKVGIIGRNGAGKSSLLKIVTRAIEPTSGRLEVHGRTHALLQLGTGFHPDFTGRENALSFLAHLGVSGADADRLVDDAIEFAEIEEYVDQPLKTYSTGMAARLMFAVSTAIEPELLVIDEVLGVGDAYFQNKSFERIRELCANRGTTLLLVSHDVYSAAKLCDRMIWIDRGRIRADGSPSATLKLYEDSIRIQEDARQKQKLALTYRNQIGARDTVRPAFVELRARNNEPTAAPVHIAALSLDWPDGASFDLPILTDGDRTSQQGYFARLLPHTPWGQIELVDGRRARVWSNFGTVEHKVGVAIFTEGASRALHEARLRLELRSQQPVDADVVFIGVDGAEHVLGRINDAGTEWVTQSFALDGGSLATATPMGGAAVRDRQGSGRVVATAFDLLGPDGRTAFNLEHGQRATFAFDYRISDPNLNERCQVVFAFKRNGVDDVVRTIARDIHFAAGRAREGRIEMTLDPLRLGTGKYGATLMIAAEGYFENTDGRFFSINPDVYDCHSLCIEFEVHERDSLLPRGTAYVADAAWRQIDLVTAVQQTNNGALASAS